MAHHAGCYPLGVSETWEQELGRVAYEAYREQAGGRSLASGEQLPSWTGQRTEVQRAWEVAARAVAEIYRDDVTEVTEVRFTEFAEDDQSDADAR